jgi:2-dehydropantoate 2-reductase
MRFVIVGAGGVGGNLGARLVEAGHRVAWLARGRNLAALREGLRLESPLGDVVLGAQEASDDARELAPVDAVIVAVKMYSLPSLAPSLRPFGDAWLLPLQNGIEAHGMLTEALPRARVLKGMVVTKSHLAAPGSIVCKSGFSRIKLGGAPQAELAPLLAAMNSGKGVSAEFSGEIETELWRKLVMLASFSAVSCLARATIGQIRESPDAYRLVLEAVAEAVAVARARNVELPADIAELVDSLVRDLPREGRPSMLEDLEARRALELDYLSGAIVRLGAQYGIPTPFHTMACRALAMHKGEGS